MIIINEDLVAGKLYNFVWAIDRHDSGLSTNNFVGMYLGESIDTCMAKRYYSVLSYLYGGRTIQIDHSGWEAHNLLYMKI